MNTREMNGVHRWVGAGAALAVLLIATATVARGDDNGNEEAFTTTTTHVELDSIGRFFKIEVPEPKPGAGKRAKEAKRAPESVFANIFGLVSVDYRKYGSDNNNQFVRLGVLRIPFFTVMQFDGDKGFDQDNYISGNLFALCDLVVDATESTGKKSKPAAKQEDDEAEKDGEKENADEKGPPLEPRYYDLAVLDSLIFTAYQARFQAPEKKYWEILDVPMVTTLSHETDTDQNRWKFLNVPLLWVFRYEQDGARERTHLVDGPGVALFRRDHTEDKSDKWEFVDLLLLKAMRGRQGKDKSHFGFVESFKLGHGPFLSVYSSDEEKEKREGDRETVSSRQFVRLPFLGPVLGTWRDSKGGHFAPFPSIFLSRKNRPEAFRVF